MPVDSSRSKGGAFSQADRSNFVEAVLSRNLIPDRTQVVYYFAGTIGKDVIDMVLESSSSATEAVSSLARMSAVLDRMSASESPAGEIETPKKGEGSRAPQDTEGFFSGVSAATAALAATRRQAMTLEAINAQKASVLCLRPKPDDGGGGVEGEGVIEMEKVAAFICSYAGEQEAAAGVPSKPPPSPFSIPRGTHVPSSERVQMVIIRTAEKTVQVPGFEAFLKLQHGQDALFSFLGSNHELHSYYLMAKDHSQQAVLNGKQAREAGAPKAASSLSSSSPASSRSPPRSASLSKPIDPEVEEIVNLLGGGGAPGL